MAEPYEIPTYKGFELAFFERVRHVLCTFKQNRLGGYNGRYSRYYSLLREICIPEDDQFYFGGSINSEDYRQHSPEPVYLVRKGVNLLLSFLMSPTNRFFRLDKRHFHTQLPLGDLEEKIKDSSGLNSAYRQEQSFYEGLTEDAHSVIQSARNFHVEALVRRDRFVFGHGGKVIEYDEDNVALFKHILPENFILESSVGNRWDMPGYVDEKSDYAAFKTLGKPLYAYDEKYTVMNDFSLSFGNQFRKGNSEGDSTRATTSGDGTNYYRFNLPYGVLEDIVLSSPDWDMGDRKRAKELLKKHFYKPRWEDITTPEDCVVDVWFDDNTIFEPVALKNKNIIFGGMHLGPNELSINNGFGKDCLGMFTAFSEIFLMNMTSYERTMVPPYVFADEAKSFGINLTQNGYVYAPAGEAPPSVLASGADMNAAIAWWHEMIRQLETALFIREFEITDKTHQTKQQVQIQSTEGYRNVATVASIEQADDLNPTVFCLVQYLYGLAAQKERYKGLYLNARYDSPVTYAQQNSFVNRSNVFLDSIMKYEQVKATGSNAAIGVSGDRFTTMMADATGMTGTLEEQKILEAKQNTMIQEQKIKDEALIAQAEQGKLNPQSLEQGGTGGRNSTAQTTPATGQSPSGAGQTATGGPKGL